MAAFVEQDLTFEGHRVHCWEGGEGYPLLLLHGTGPGTSTTGNFLRLMPRLAERCRVLAADLIGFGLSGRKTAPPYFDFALWLRQAKFLLARLPPGPVGVFGHSLSGALALRLAADDPRVAKVLTTGAVGTRFPVPPELATIWTYPETRDDLRRAIECLVYDRSIVTDAFVDSRLAALRDDPTYAAYFRGMFGGDKQALVDSAAIAPADLGRIAADVAMIHGRDDRPVPARLTTLVLAEAIPRVDVTIIGRCGHSPSLEHPDKVLAQARLLFG